MYVTCLEQQSFCHALCKNLKFKLLYFQNKECYPAEKKQADGNLYFLLCDEDKNQKLCLVMNFSFLWRHVKTKNIFVLIVNLGNSNTEVTFETLSGNLMARKEGTV